MRGVFLKMVCRAAIGLGILVVATGRAQRSEGELPYDASLLPEDYRSPGAPPAEGKPIRKYAVDAPGPAATNFGVSPVHDNMRFSTLSVDRLEMRRVDQANVGLWDVQAWTGRDFNKLVIESEGEWSFEEDKVEASEVEVLLSHVFSRYWEVRGGVRYDPEPEPRWWYATLGVEGLAPQWVETEATLYLSEEGDVTAGLELEYDMLFTQRLILQPRMEAAAAMQDVPERGLYAGLTGWEVGLRLRYEAHRKFAPYIGVSWEQALGETADWVEDQGGSTGDLVAVAGLRCWL